MIFKNIEISDSSIKQAKLFIALENSKNTCRKQRVGYYRSAYISTGIEDGEKESTKHYLYREKCKNSCDAESKSKDRWFNEL